MKLELFQKKSRWSSSAEALRVIRALTSFLILALAAAGLCGAQGAAQGSAQDNAKARAKAVRDLAKQGPSAISQITPYLSDPDAGVRLETTKAIAQIGTQQSLDPLVKALGDNSPEVQIRAANGLVNFYLPGYVDSGIGGHFKRVATAVKSKFTDTNDQVIDPYIQVRPDVIEALGKVARGGASPDARANAARALGVLRGKAAIPDLIQAVKSNDTDTIYEALVALQKIRDPSVGPDIAFRLSDPAEKVQLTAIQTAGVLAYKPAASQLRESLDRSKKQDVRRAALSSLAMIPDESLRGVYRAYLHDKDDALRTAALEGLGRLRNPADQADIQNAFSLEKKMGPRLAAAFALVEEGNNAMTEFAPLRYLVNQLNSAAYDGVALPYLKELARDEGVRQSLRQAFEQAPTKEEKIGLAQVFGASGQRDSMGYLDNLSKDPDPDVAKEALRAMQNLRARTGA